jgi:TonB-linked SusC/RagA family outer membrane protein
MLGVLLGVTAARDAHAQATGTVRGRVVEDSVVPVPGATITIAGTRLGGVTDNDGRYVIRGVPAGAQSVRFTRIGLTPQVKTATVIADQETTVDFNGAKSAVRLEEIVTTATGEQSRRAVGNSVAVINTEDLVKTTGVTTATEVLTARVPGVTVVQGAGMIGGSPSVVIRGRTSVGASSDPLWIIDGIRMVSGDLNRSFTQNGNSTLGSLSTQDIESIDVIKGPSATALYGTQANNGVIIVRTKRGQAGTTRWTVWNETGRNDQPADWPANYRSWGRNINTATGQPTGAAIQCRPAQKSLGTCVIDSLTSFSPFTHAETTPFGQMGRRLVFGGSVSGGTDRIRYYTSAELMGDRGPYTMPDREIRRLTTLLGHRPSTEQIYPNQNDQQNYRGNFNAQVSKRSELSVAGSYTDRRLRSPFNGSFFQGIQIQGLTAPGYRTPFDGYAAQYLGDIMSVRQPEKERRMTGNLTYTIAPITWLTTHATLGIDRSSQDAQVFAAVGEGTNGGWGQLVGRNGGYRKALTDFGRYSADVGASASFALRSDLLSTTSAGGQWFKDSQYELQVSGYGLAPGTTTIPSAGTKAIDAERLVERASYGVFVDQQFAWRERLYVSGGLRYDASNVFGPAAKRPMYPRAQVSYVISDESFFPKTAGLDRLRLRTAWGESGSAPGATQGLQVLVPSTVQYGTTVLPTLLLTDGFNPAIKPEITSEFEGGFDATVLGERVNLEFTLYRKINRNGITNVPLAPSLGTATSFPINLGRVENKGYEFSIDIAALQTHPISWDLKLSGSHTTNLVKVVNNQPPAAPALQRTLPGYPIQGAWSRPITGWNDANGDGILTAAEVTVGADWKYIGPVLPTDEAQLSSAFSFFNRRLTLLTLFDYRGGNYHQFGGGSDRCNGGSAREANDPTAPLELQAACIARTNSSLGSTLWGYIKPADFIKLREASLTAPIPPSVAQRVRLRNATVSLTARNLSTLWTKYPGLDPEAGGQFNDNWTVPPLRYFLVRLNLTF